MNEQLFMLRAVATASPAHYRIHNSTCPECACPIMLTEQPNGEHLVAEGGGEGISILEVAKILMYSLTCHKEVTLSPKSQAWVCVL